MFKQLSRELLSQSRSLLHQWFPEGRVQGKEFVVGSIRGEKGSSLSINMETGQWADFAGTEKGGDLISLYAAIHGTSQAQAARDLGGVALGGKIKKKRPSPPDNATIPSMSHAKWGDPSSVWTYREKDGRVIGYIARYDPPGERKQIVPWTWDDEKKCWRAMAFCSPRPLYGLDRLAAMSGVPGLIVEGEKAADAAAKIVGDHFAVVTWPGGAKAVGKVDWSPLHFRAINIWPDADKPGVEAASDIAAALAGNVPSIHILDVSGQDDGWDAADALADGWTWDEFSAWSAPRWRASAKSGERPEVRCGFREDETVEAAISALASDPDIFCRSNRLVRIIRDPGRLPSIGELPVADLRTRLTTVASILKYEPDHDEWVASHPPQWLVQGVHARGSWPRVRRLTGISDVPVLRDDGSVWQSAGFDERTGILYEPFSAIEPIPDDVDIDDASDAIESLNEIVCDFRFESESHKSSWLAALLTPFARPAFSGPSPLFLFDANVRGAGKGKLAQVIGQIVMGRELPTLGYSHDDSEMDKRITSVALSGDRLVLLDNLCGPFGNAPLDSVLTSTTWDGRILGKNEKVCTPINTVWLATGNNVQVVADTIRRIIHCRLDVLDEHPENRRGFRHPRLEQWVASQRPRFVRDCLVILAAYIRAGSPGKDELKPIGSYEGWSSLVRGSLVWAGMVDPGESHDRFAEHSDTTNEMLEMLLNAWVPLDWGRRGFTASELLAAAYGEGSGSDEASDMRDAIELLTGCPSGKRPSARQVGMRLKAIRRRVVGGRMIDVSPVRSGAGVRWVVATATN